jgi:hypothetical protein
MEQARYILTYRAAEARRVMNWINAGGSGCLIGLRGAGKSNFLHFLLRQDVQEYYLGRDHTAFVLVLVDLLALADHTEWAVYELLLDRLLGQLRQVSVEQENIKEMVSLHRQVRRSRAPTTAQRAVERCVDILCQRPGGRVVLLFDDFDTVFCTLDPSLFRCLRAIRDAHKGQVSYVVVVAEELAELRDDLAPVEHFHRLVSRNVCGLGPYGEGDARWMIRNLASQRAIELSIADTVHLIELSGGHAGLLKAILSLLWDAGRDDDGSTEASAACDEFSRVEISRTPVKVLAELLPALSDEPAVQTECRKMWNGLSESEQAALCALACGVQAQADPHTLGLLECRGLTRKSQSEISLFSPLFADFVLRQAPPPAKDVIVSRSPRMAQIDGQRVETLTELEFEMLCYLYEHRGQVCTKDELIENVYRQQYDRMTGGVTDAALQTLISRLREKIEPDRGRPRYVVTIRGEGYKFVEPGGG